MSRLPIPGQDNGTWGNILNDFLNQAHKPDGLLKSGSVDATIIADGAITSSKLTASSVNATHLGPASVGIAALQDNSVSAAKIINDTVSEAKLDAGVRAKLNATSSIVIPDNSIAAIKLNTPASPAPANGDVLVRDNSTPGGYKWQAITTGSAAPSGPAGGDLAGTYPNPILKPASVATASIQDGAVNSQKLADKAITAAKLSPAILPAANQILSFDGTNLVWVNAPTASAPQVNADWNASSGVARILNKPTLSSVATTGNYNDLTNRPTLPTTLETITDVTAASATDKQVLSYDSASGQWVPNTVTSTTVSDATTGAKGIIQLAGDLGGIATTPTVNKIKGIALPATAPTNGQVLTATGASTTAWVSPVTTSIDTDATLGGVNPSDSKLSSQKATKTYIDSSLSAKANVSDLANYVPTAQKATANGIATLDGSGKIPASQLPSSVSDPAVGGDLSGTASNAQIIANAVGSNELATDAVTTVKIADKNVTTAKLADQAVTSTQIATGTIVEANLAQSVKDKLTQATNSIQNQFTSAQSADYWISGKAKVEDQVTLGGKINQTQLLINAASEQSAANPLVKVQDSTGTELFRIHQDSAHNMLFGYMSGASLSSGAQYNTGIGEGALASTTSGQLNAGIGAGALSTNTTGSSNTGVGAIALRYNSTGSNNTAVGEGALTTNTTGSNNSALGVDALTSNTTGGFNVAVGVDALTNNTTSNYLTAVGNAALRSNTSGEKNIAVGASALEANTTGWSNTAIGTDSMISNIGGFNNVAVGEASLKANTTGVNNIAVGFGSLLSNTTGQRNVAVGSDSMKTSVEGSDNIGIGSGSLGSTSTGAGNVGIGSIALASNVTGNNNTALGYGAGDSDVSGQFRTPPNISGSTAIGHHAQVQLDNSIVLGAIDTPTRVGIGTTKPINTFSVSPVIYNTGTAAIAVAGTDQTTVQGTGTTWTTAMVGKHLIFADGRSSLITAVNSATELVISGSHPIAPNQQYRIHSLALGVSDTGRVGIGTSAPIADLHVDGRIYVERIDAIAHAQHGRLTSTTADTFANQWTRIAYADITAQFDDARSIATLISVGDAGYTDRVTIDFKVKQQTPLGQAPDVFVQLNQVVGINDTDIVAVTTENSATKTSVGLWMRIRRDFQTFSMAQIVNHYGLVEWDSQKPFQTTLPSGAQTPAVLMMGAEEWTTVAPTTATSPGVKGQKAYDATYLYICIANNSWRRVAITSW